MSKISVEISNVTLQAELPELGDGFYISDEVLNGTFPYSLENFKFTSCASIVNFWDSSGNMSTTYHFKNGKQLSSQQVINQSLIYNALKDKIDWGVYGANLEFFNLYQSLYADLKPRYEAIKEHLKTPQDLEDFRTLVDNVASKLIEKDKIDMFNKG